jgi:surface carbohydrate biosynthesis protein
MRIALLVDNPFRDLPGLVLTAAFLCERGQECYLVPANLREPEIWSLAPDFVLLHQLRTVTQEFARALLDSGIGVGVLDTEGGVFTSLNAYAGTMAPDASVRHRVGCFCSWGSKLAEHAATNDWYRPGQIAVTGSPRFDFYVHPWRAATLKSSAYADSYLGQMVLINGNFPIANPQFKTPEEEVNMLVERFNFVEKEARRVQEGQRETMLELSGLSNHLATKLPAVKFIYRPHPFENEAAYRDLLEPRENLHLVKEGTVDGWILRSSAVIQRGCSTAIEAGMAGIPALSPDWIPTPSTMEAAEAVSIPCHSEEDLTEKLRRFLAGNAAVPDSIKIALEKVISDWFYKNDGQAHRRVGDGILKALERSPRRKDLSKCRAQYYGINRPGVPPGARATARLRRAFGLPVHWSFQRMRNITGELPWDNTEKYFDVSRVRTIMIAITESSPAASYESLSRIKVEAAQERGDYLFRYGRGRAVAMFRE